MEILQSELRKELAIIEEDDEFYERIEAPKFIDFTVPERSRPDDKSWFCVRIGCDQQHEEVDSDALYRSFMLRVMAARSPNLKLQKALNRQAPRSIKKPLQSAPAKSAKDRISRLSTITSIPDKMAKTRLKDHPISSLRSTPNHIKAKVQPLTTERKALTAPRNKKCPTNQEPFRSVKHQKASVAVSNNRSVAKALFLHTPRREAEASNVTVLKVCDGMKQLKIGKHTPGGHLRKSSRCAACDPNHPEISSKKGEETSISSKKNNEGCLLQENVCKGPCNTEINSTLSIKVEEYPPSSIMSIAKESRPSTIADSTSTNNPKTHCNSEEDSKENVLLLQTLREEGTETGTMDNVAYSNGNKENDSGTYETRNMNLNNINSESESLQSETCENLPQKATRAPGNIIQEQCTQGGKLKRTNPKPFRLRTDERGILKEANLERRLQLEAQKETALAFKCGDGKQNQARTPRAKLVRFVEAKYATSIPKCQKSENNKVIEDLQNKIVKMAPSRQFIKTQSITAARKVPFSQLRGKGGASATEYQVENSTAANTICSKGKRPATIPKEPIFHRIHVPKSCTRRPEMVIS